MPLSGYHHIQEIEEVVAERKPPSTLPEFPADTIYVLARIIEFIDDEPVAARIESIFRETQILEAGRGGLLRGEHFGSDFIEDMIQQAASLYSRAETLLGYARNQEPSVDPVALWDRVFAAFNFFGLHGPRWNNLRETAERQRTRGNQPGEADERPAY